MSRNPGLAGTQEIPFDAGDRRAPRGGRPTGETRGEGGGVDRGALLASVARDARLDRKYLLMITLSAAIATLGLLQNSPAVVIGAMLVSPLLGPIMGIGFGLVTLESALVKRSLTTLAAGMAVAILVAVLIVWVSPVQDVTSELRARTRPTLLDLGVAVVGGIAGVYAILRKLSSVMVGVAIATALVPPLSTIGFGLATGRPEFAIGAALLFLTNALAIAFAATIVARLSHFGPSLTRQHTMLQVMGIVTVLGLLSIPLALSLNSIALEVRARSLVQNAINSLLGEGDRVDVLAVRDSGGVVAVDGVVLVDSYRRDLSQRLANLASQRLDRRVTATIVQLRQQSDSALQFEDQINRRLSALERRDSESAAVLAQLVADGAIPRSAITLDVQARRVVIARELLSDAEAEESRDRAIRAAQAAHPGWLIQLAAIQARQEPR